VRRLSFILVEEEGEVSIKRYFLAGRRKAQGLGSKTRSGGFIGRRLGREEIVLTGEVLEEGGGRGIFDGPSRRGKERCCGPGENAHGPGAEGDREELSLKKDLREGKKNNNNGGREEGKKSRMTFFREDNVQRKRDRKRGHTRYITLGKISTPEQPKKRNSWTNGVDIHSREAGRDRSTGEEQKMRKIHEVGTREGSGVRFYRYCQEKKEKEEGKGLTPREGGKENYVR